MKAKLITILFLLTIFSLFAVDVTIYEIQYTTDPGGDSPYMDQEVTTTGIVTASNISGFADNFYISMPEGGGWKGLYVYNSDIEPAIGDEVEVTGEVQEYFGLTELSTGTGTIMSSGNALPDPTIVTTFALSTEEQYEGVLVQVQNVLVTSAPDNFGQWYVDDGSGACQIDDSIYQYPNPQTGMEFASITGVVDYSYDEYGLHPRDNDDFVTGGEDTTPPEITGATATSSTSVNVAFNEALSATTAENVNNYEIDGLTISNAELEANNSTVTLTTSEQTAGEEYLITINGVEDLAGNPIADDSVVNFTGYQTGGADLFISEYIEGSSNNKALEIYNASAIEVSLDDFRINQAVNGGGWEYQHYFPAGATLAAADVWVIITDEVGSALFDPANADEILSYPSVVHYNGNDARALEYSSDGGTTWMIVDVLGVPDEDPGNGWDVAGVTEATTNHTLIRKSSITSGNLDWINSAGTNEANSEWIVHDQDYFDNLGSHQGSGDDETPPVVNSAEAVLETAVEISFNEPLDEATAENTANYQIDPALSISAAELSGNKVTLTTSPQTAYENYTITINNVEDLAGNVIAADTEVQFTGFGGTDYDSIADIQNNTSSYEGQTVTIRAIVTIGVNTIQTDRTNVYVQDNSDRGINIYDPQPILTLERGSEVEITGTVTQYFDTTEITDPQVTVLSVNNPEPEPYELDLADIGNIDLEGTLMVVRGVIYEQYYAGGGMNLNIRDENNNEITVRVWDTTGIDTDDFVEGYNLQAIGIGSVYNGALQIVPGYQDQLSESQDVEEGVEIDPAAPTSSDDVTILFTDEAPYENVDLYWKTTTEEEFNIAAMESLDAVQYTWAAIIPAQKEGTTVIFYLAAQLGEETVYVPEGAPDEIMSYQIDITSLKAILNIPPQAFNPYAGETIDIEFGSRGGVKAILRIYDSEGKLVFTPQNLLINSSDVLTYEWNGRDKNHKLLPLGLYIIHLEIIDVTSGNKKTNKAPVVIGAPLE